MSYRDTATAIMQRAPGNFIGVVLYVPAGGQSTTPWWSAAAFPNSAALEEWYDAIAGSPPQAMWALMPRKATGSPFSIRMTSGFPARSTCACAQFARILKLDGLPPTISRKPI